MLCKDQKDLIIGLLELALWEEANQSNPHIEELQFIQATISDIKYIDRKY